MKLYVYLLCLTAAIAGFSSCKKNDDPVVVSPVVGRWELNRGIASAFPTSVSGINGREIDLYNLNSEGSTLDIYSDNTFNENYRSFDVIDGAGTWIFSNNTLSLKYDTGTQDDYTYAKTKNIEELKQVTPITYNLPISATAVASGKIQWVYRK